MKSRRIPVITKQLLVFILALLLLPCLAMAKDIATLDQQLTKAAGPGDVVLGIVTVAHDRILS
jgi:hypothetical protein